MISAATYICKDSVSFPLCHDVASQPPTPPPELIVCSPHCVHCVFPLCVSRPSSVAEVRKTFSSSDSTFSVIVHLESQPQEMEEGMNGSLPGVSSEYLHQWWVLTTDVTFLLLLPTSLCFPITLHGVFSLSQPVQDLSLCQFVACFRAKTVNVLKHCSTSLVCLGSFKSDTSITTDSYKCG